MISPRWHTENLSSIVKPVTTPELRLMKCPAFSVRTPLCTQKDGLGLIARGVELAKDFELPTAKDVLRFRYTTYLGENHPAESKVVVEFAPHVLPLTKPEKDKLIKLAGVRYDPRKRTVKMSCESYEYQAQNKRYLSDKVDKLIAAARVS